MRLWPDTTYRSQEPEIMDDLEMEGEQLRDTLDTIATLNRRLGGNRLTLSALPELISKAEGRSVHITDMGCGGGDMLREIADWGKRQRLDLRLTGIDANADTIAHARQLSGAYPNIAYEVADIFDPKATSGQTDIILCTLTLHHFTENEILRLLRNFRDSARIGIVINDLHRSGLAYRLYQLVCVVFGLGKMPTNDGLISILRGFKRKELRTFSRKLNFQQSIIRWKWAFRYQWVISFI